MKTNNIMVVRIIGGENDWEIEVPIDATIREIIEFLVNEDFFNSSCVNINNITFYRKDSDGAVFKCGDHGRTIKEYGGKDKDIFHCFVGYEALYGCPTAKGVQGVVPTCMNSCFENFDIRYI